MKVLLSLIAALLTTLIAPPQCHGQGNFKWTVTFDGPPLIPPGSGVFTTSYYENGMNFTPINPGENFSRAGGGAVGFPENGTAYILQGFANSLAGWVDSVSHFGLISVDLSEFSTFYAFPQMVQFIGYRSDGSTVTTAFTTDGIIDGTGPLADFQTFYFGPEFSDVVRFEVPTHTYALDNMVFMSVVPEPRTNALLILGATLLGILRFARKRVGS